MRANGTWQPVTRVDPCPACGKADWCAYAPDGVLKCERSTEIPPGYRLLRPKDGGALFKPIDDSYSQHVKPPFPTNWKPSAVPPASSVARDLRARHDQFKNALTEELVAELSRALGLPAHAILALDPGWADGKALRQLNAGGAGWKDCFPDGAFAFPERNGRGDLVGFSFRTFDGRKGAPSRSAGCRRGLIVPATLRDLTAHGPVLIVEGASDVAACIALGLPAVGRPSAAAGSDDLADLLRLMKIIVLGERDAKEGGRWPGRDGAIRIAEQLASRWHRDVRLSLPPYPCKDMRGWLNEQIKNGLDLDDADQTRDARSKLLEDLEFELSIIEPEKRSQADLLVDLAHARFRLGRTTSGEAFAVRRSGRNVALTFRSNRDNLKAELASAFRRAHGKVPSGSALNDALTALEGEAADETPEPVALRVASWHESGINSGLDTAGVVIDLGQPSGAAVVVTEKGWRVEEVSPVLFRRTGLTGALPVPERGGNLAQLRDMLNVDNDGFAIAIAFLVTALVPDVPHPILLLDGEQGTGKSTAARIIGAFIDPSPAPLRTEPRSLDDWAVAANGAYVVTLDNISRIPPWLSDALCKAVTGDGLVKRALYTDSTLTILSFRRVVILTSIDTGALRGDLADRILKLELQRIPEEKRRTETELDAAIRACLPKLFGALLDLLSLTMAAFPTVQVDRLPRMADAARVFAAVDQAAPELTGGRAFDLLLGQRDQLAQDVVEDDEVAQAVQRFAREHSLWEGTVGELHKLAAPGEPSKSWPRNARGFSGRLRRAAPSLERVGVLVEFKVKASDGRRVAVMWRLGSEPTGPSGPSPAAPEKLPEVIQGDDLPLGGDGRASAEGSSRHIDIDAGSLQTGLSDGRDGRAGSRPQLHNGAGDQEVKL